MESKIGCNTCRLLYYYNNKNSCNYFQIIHAATGIVKSNPIITLMQVFSRVNLVALLCVSQPSQESFGLPLSIICWSITEIIRYSYYAGSLVKYIPSFLTWLRYSTFFVLYPSGVTGELICLYYGQKFIGDNNLYSIEMPNRFNFTFSMCYFLWMVMLSYIPFFPQLFGHLLTQRKKILGGSDSSRATEKSKIK